MAMTDLALRGGDGPLAVNDLAERQELSVAYLEQLFHRLRKAGLVDSTRGRAGGVMLARRAEDISVGEILTAVDQPMKATRCNGVDGCLSKGARCLTHDLWHVLGQHVQSLLNGISLADVARGDLPDIDADMPRPVEILEREEALS
jgi:Rrf2 family iron-sulfur cluster assembly transcriptional regulator